MPRKPLLLKAIAAAFFVLPLACLLLVAFGPVAHRVPYSVKLLRLLSIAIWSVEITGAVLLWRLRRGAFYMFAGALLLGIVNFWLDVLIRGGVDGLHPFRITPTMTIPPLTGRVIGAALLLGVCVYTWRLCNSGLLKSRGA